jgi:putative flavoprotein involved in K+ transport
MGANPLEIVIVGGGQAALALSYRLTEQGRSHLILEQGRVVESWRSKRWDSLRMIAPNWSLIMPGFAYPGNDPDGYMTKDEVVGHLVGYARSFDAPVREGVRALAIEHASSDGTFLVRTETGSLEATQVVIATGSLQRPNVPPYAAEIPTSIATVFPSQYRNPAGLPPGKVLIVGSGETGCQISEELARAGRTVYLSAGRSWWAPRRYRGRDISAWLRLVGWFDRTVEDLPQGARTGQANPQLTGADGGHDINAHTLVRDGVTLIGRLQGVSDGIAVFARDLSANIAWGDDQARALLQAIDALVVAQGLDVSAPNVPFDLHARPQQAATTEHLSRNAEPTKLDLAREGISCVIWATGYRPDLTWVHLPFLDAEGYPIQRRGVTIVPGLYILGLDWLHTAKSGLFAGIGDDATYLASIIASR